MTADVDFGRELSMVDISIAGLVNGTIASVCAGSLVSYCISASSRGLPYNTTNLSYFHNLQRQSKTGWVERIGADTCSSISVWGDRVA